MLRSKPHAVFHGVCEIALSEVLATQMGVMRRSKKVSSFELHKFNQLSPHCDIVQELCESRGGRPGLSVLTSLLVSVDVKIY